MPRGIPRDNSTNRKILHRFKITQGHLGKVIKMTESGEYCLDIIHQSLAVQSALKQIDNLVMKNHMETCMADAIKKGKGKEVVNEVIEVMKKI